MDDLEKRIQETVSQKMNDGTIEKINLKIYKRIVVAVDKKVVVR